MCALLAYFVFLSKEMLAHHRRRSGLLAARLPFFFGILCEDLTSLRYTYFI